MAGRRVPKDGSFLYKPALLDTPEEDNFTNLYRPGLLNTPGKIRSMSPIDLHRTTLLSSPDRSRSRSPIDFHRSALLSSPDRSRSISPIDFHRSALLSSPDESRSRSPIDSHRTALLSSPDESRSRSSTDFHRSALLSSPDRSRSTSPIDLYREALLSSSDRSRSRSPIDLHRPSLLSTPRACHGQPRHSSYKHEGMGEMERAFSHNGHHQDTYASTKDTRTGPTCSERSRLSKSHASGYDQDSMCKIERFEYNHGGSRTGCQLSGRNQSYRSFSLTQTAYQLENRLTSAQEACRLEDSLRLKQMNTFKQSRDYELFGGTIMRGSNSVTPDYADIPNSNGTSSVTDWKSHIAQEYVQNCFNPSSQTVMTTETGEEMLLRRQKNIDYGKANGSYNTYITLISKQGRSARDPRTPDKFATYSRRAWDGAVKSWKKRIHRRVEELTDG